MRSAIQIGHRTISRESPLFIMAEIGVTCNYDITLTKELIDAVSASGGDAVKFIFWFPDEIMSDRTISYSYQTVDGPRTENMFEMLSSLRFSLDQWFEIKAYADARDIVLFATVNSPSGIEYAERLNLEAYKLSSWDYNYFTLWRRVAEKQRPMLIDTGPVTVLEVAKVMQLMIDAGNDQSVLIHCTHADEHREFNMRAIPYMHQAFDTLVGYSAAGAEDETDVMAVTLGACVLEKRLTMSRRLPGHHHVLSKEPGEFASYVRLMRNVREALGGFELRPSTTDLAERRKWFRHMVAARDLPAGTSLTEDMIAGKRPESGVSPEYADLFVGRALRRPLRANEALRWEDV